MFHNIPQATLNRMHQLEAIDARDRQDGTPHLKRLRQIPPETGKFLALLAANAPAGEMLEIGTSAGYSSLWLGLACHERGDRLTTFEILEEKVHLAQETFAAAEVNGTIRLIPGDGLKHLPEYRQIAFCFMDAEKEIYDQCYELVIPNLVHGGLFVADNVLSHQEQLKPVVERALSDERVDAEVIPIGKGILVCRKI